MVRGRCAPIAGHGMAWHGICGVVVEGRRGRGAVTWRAVTRSCTPPSELSTEQHKSNSDVRSEETRAQHEPSVCAGKAEQSQDKKREKQEAEQSRARTKTRTKTRPQRRRRRWRRTCMAMSWSSMLSFASSRAVCSSASACCFWYSCPPPTPASASASASPLQPPSSPATSLHTARFQPSLTTFPNPLPNTSTRSTCVGEQTWTRMALNCCRRASMLSSRRSTSASSSSRRASSASPRRTSSSSASLATETSSWSAWARATPLDGELEGVTPSADISRSCRKRREEPK
eukprot:3591152-Rhodomonas_salina.1